MSSRALDKEEFERAFGESDAAAIGICMSPDGSFAVYGGDEEDDDLVDAVVAYLGSGMYDAARGGQDGAAGSRRPVRVVVKPDGDGGASPAPQPAKGGNGGGPRGPRTIVVDDGCDDLHNHKQLGAFGERLAARYLEDLGLRIVERNHRTEYGEADLVCLDGPETVLVEVKTRLGCRARPEESVTPRKMERYRKIMLDYLRQRSFQGSVRFDVVAVNVLPDDDVVVRHFMGVCLWES